MPKVRPPEFDSKIGCWIIKADAVGPSGEDLFLHVDLNIYNDTLSYTSGGVLIDTGRYITENTAMIAYKNYCSIYEFDDNSTASPISNGTVINSQPLFDD